MYAKCNDLQSAKQVSLKVNIQCFIIHVDRSHIFVEMQESGFSPDEYTYSPMLSVIANSGSLQEGQQIHTQLKVDIAAIQLSI